MVRTRRAFKGMCVILRLGEDGESHRSCCSLCHGRFPTRSTKQTAPHPRRTFPTLFQLGTGPADSSCAASEIVHGNPCLPTCFLCMQIPKLCPMTPIFAFISIFSNQVGIIESHFAEWRADRGGSTCGSTWLGASRPPRDSRFFLCALIPFSLIPVRSVVQVIHFYQPKATSSPRSVEGIRKYYSNS